MYTVHSQCQNYVLWHPEFTFPPTHSSDVQCGQLHCIPGSFENNFDVSLTILTVGVFVSGVIEQCQ